MKIDENPLRFVEAIAHSKLTIYQPINVGDPVLWIPASALEVILQSALCGLSLAGLPLRTRSKVVKQYICKGLGYPVPKSFPKTQPRFVGQCFDTYVQKSNNLQIWNEEIDASRRYVIIRVSDHDIITKIKVIGGENLARLDTTGTLTQKYQARLTCGIENEELITPVDTERLSDLVSEDTMTFPPSISPVSNPQHGQLLSISSIFNRLKGLIGTTFLDSGIVQERNRGVILHRAICNQLSYSNYQDDGRFPDVRHQLLEVKLQTSPTIDLGLVSPDSTVVLDVPQIENRYIRHCDVRYAIFHAVTDGNKIQLTHFFLTTGEGFFNRFNQFGGKVLNKKLQIPLPLDFFGN